MKSLKLSLMALVLIGGISGALVNRIQAAPKPLDPTYNWLGGGVEDNGRTVAQAQMDYGCTGTSSLCATGKPTSGSGQEGLRSGMPEINYANKIELKLTVAQLALLIRLLYEEGIFAMKNIASLLRFFSMHFMSKKQEHISHGSMNKLYYSSDQFTGIAVKELLLKMIAKINKMFFPM